jgi:hypothetical protein
MLNEKRLWGDQALLGQHCKALEFLSKTKNGNKFDSQNHQKVLPKW